MSGIAQSTWRRFVRIAQVAVAVSLLVFLWRAVDGADALELLTSADPGWLAAAIAILTLQTLLSALRWRLTAAQLGQDIGFRQAVREYYLAQVVNQSLPGGVVGDAGRAVRNRAQAGLLRASQAVILERLAGQAMLFLVMVAAVVAAAVVPGGLALPDWVGMLVLALSVGAAAALAAVILSERLGGRAGRAARGLREAVHAALLAPGVLPRQVALSLATTACNLAAFAVCARATGTMLPPAAILAVVPLILFTMLIPVSVSGWGLREGAAAALFPAIGASAAEGLAASVAFGLVFVATVLPGVVPLLNRGPKRPAQT